jgi:hypothetical protein
MPGPVPGISFYALHDSARQNGRIRRPTAPAHTAAVPGDAAGFFILN